VLAQHVEGRHTEVAGTDERDPHVFFPSLERFPSKWKPVQADMPIAHPGRLSRRRAGT
jgi:hypothetical protein